MPVEIRELIIRAVVTTHDHADAETTSTIPDDEREAIVAASVRQVLKILKRTRER
jgi:hypothetical protein